MREEAEDWLIALRLSRAGYGDAEDIAKWDARRTLQALSYEKFLSDYEEAYLEELKS